MGKILKKILPKKSIQKETRDLLLLSLKSRFEYYKEARVNEPESARKYRIKIIIWLVIALIFEVATIITRFNLLVFGLFIVALFILYMYVRQDSKNEKETIAKIRDQQREDYKDNADIALEEVATAISPEIGPEIVAMYLLDNYEPPLWIKIASTAISTILICLAVQILPGYNGRSKIMFIGLVLANLFLSYVGAVISKHFDNDYKDIYHYDILGSYLDKFHIIEENAKNKLSINDGEGINTVSEGPEDKTKTS
ncbi:hypothetical protein [Pseudobutyrivibrio xylanivorans]|uniref:Uncharacterized protein n=1 Tax=Pseudobutyrivibrio xylanivorans TaxID=185007 RepID=A0A1G5RUG4_PSEXY|nr:hypothetical protein [Pseudobutyrivibrio xylanivorans]SCZ77508.1 hypothetical protein SAMN02910350_00828 [Pseudobutyrivibrio xylanivorans]